MRPTKEQKDLAQRPLPVEPATKSDLTLPTQLYQIDNELFRLRESMERLQEIRQNLLQRAVDLKIMQDAMYEIIRVEKNKPRKINLEEFKKQYPAEYKLACEIVLKERKAVIEKAVEAFSEPIQRIKIETANVLLSKRMVDNICYPHEVDVSYVVARQEKLKEKT
jgi:hypothetical protein